MNHPSQIVLNYKKFLLNEFEKYLVEQYGSEFLEISKDESKNLTIQIGISKNNKIYKKIFYPNYYKFLDFYDDDKNLHTVNQDNSEISKLLKINGYKTIQKVSNRILDLIEIINQSTYYHAEIHEIPIYNKLKFNEHIFNDRGQIIKTEQKYVINEKSLFSIEVILSLTLKKDEKNEKNEIENKKIDNLIDLENIFC